MSVKCPFIPPHMASCNTHGGLPMPKVISDTMEIRCELVPCEWPGVADLMTRSAPVSGQPNFGKYDDEKHRRCMLERWCHVCGESDCDLMVCCPDAPQWRDVDGKQMMMLIQPWVCAPCLAYATRACPPLRKTIDEDRGFVFANMKDARIVVMLWKPARPDDPVPPPGKSVLGSFKLLVPPEAICQRLPAWSKTVGARYWRNWQRHKKTTAPA